MARSIIEYISGMSAGNHLSEGGADPASVCPCKVTGACCILHNVCAAEGDILEGEDEEEEEGSSQDDNSDEDDADERELSGNGSWAIGLLHSCPLLQKCLHVWVSMTTCRGQTSPDVHYDSSIRAQLL